MTPEAQAYLDKADLALAKAQAMLTVGYPDEAGRLAYYAAHHAAQALIFERTAKTSKSHKGVKAQFARIAKAEGLPRDLIAFLARTYPMKEVADYEIGQAAVVAPRRASDALAGAQSFVARIRAHMGPP